MNTPYPKKSPSLWQQPKKIAFIIAVIIGVWILSGLLLPSEQVVEKDSVAISQKKVINPSELPVKVEALNAQERSRSITLNGVTEPKRITLVEAETEGKVEEILFTEGALVEEDAVLMRLDERDRRNKIAEANALLKQRKVELNAAKKLYEKGFQSKVRLTQAEAAVASARRMLKQAQLDFSYTTIRAPYTGLIEETLVEEGDLVGKGFNKQTVMRFVDLSPLKITGQISELERGKIKVGDAAKIRFSSGETTSGTIGFVASVADDQTRTFRIEIEVPNPERKLQAGVSAEISLQADTELAYEVSSSVLSLDDSGQVGVKRVDEQNIIRFTPVEVLTQSDNGVWIAGLPPQVRLVTEGVSFVSEGQIVESDTAAPAESTDEVEG